VGTFVGLRVGSFVGILVVGLSVRGAFVMVIEQRMQHLFSDLRHILSPRTLSPSQAFVIL
jgi:hypothetical protein